MKILFYRNTYDAEYESIILSISKTDNKFGYLHGEINKKGIQEFNPDIIIHNIPNETEFPIKTNAISININETHHKNSFSFKDKSSSNYLEPFVKLISTDVDEKDLPKFSSDVVYIGSPTVFGELFAFVSNPSNNIHFRFFSNQLVNTNGYCGYCPANDYLKFYKYSKMCLVIENDVSRIRDIIVSDGNPILYNGNNAKECIEKIKQSIKDNTKYSINGYTKKEILDKHTSYDRACQIFRTIGLKKLADNILTKKGWEK